MQKRIKNITAGSLAGLFTLAATSFSLRPDPVTLPPVFDPDAPKPTACDANHPLIGIVYTGTSARVVKGLELLRDDKVDILAISGTGTTKLTAQNIGTLFKVTLTPEQTRRITLDYQSRDTQDNADYTTQYLHGTHACAGIIITSKEHMERSVYLTQRSMNTTWIHSKPFLMMLPVDDKVTTTRKIMRHWQENNKLWFEQRWFQPPTPPALYLPVPPTDSQARRNTPSAPAGMG